MLNIINFAIIVAQSIDYAGVMLSMDMLREGYDKKIATRAHAQAVQSLMSGDRIALRALSCDLAEYMVSESRILTLEIAA